MKKKLDDVTIIAILMVAVIIMGCMMFSSPKNDKIKRIALTATTTSITTTSTTVTTTTTTSTTATSKITTTNTSTTMTTTTTTTTDNTTTTSRITTTSTSNTTLADTTTVTTTTSPVESTTDTYEATVIYKEEQPEPIELFDQELYYEPIEMIEETTPVEIEETTIEDKDIYYFYEGSMRVHTPSCIYADPSCMEVIEDGYIDYARKCTECNPDIEIGTIYEEPIIEEDDDTYYEESDSLTRNWTVDEMTYYSGPYGCYGPPGRTLINNYSVACNSIPLGTIVYIQSSDGSVDGYYRVDDTGGMGNNVIDIFYSDYSYTPYSFRQAGRVSCTVWIVE